MSSFESFYEKQTFHEKPSPYPFPRELPEVEFRLAMSAQVSFAMLGCFTGSLWAVAIRSDLANVHVDCFMWFDSEPTFVDRDELSYFATAFSVAGYCDVGLTIHWMAIPYHLAPPIDRSLHWVYRQRDPARRYPDEFDESDLEY